MTGSVAALNYATDVCKKMFPKSPDVDAFDGTPGPITRELLVFIKFGLFAPGPAIECSQKRL